MHYGNLTKKFLFCNVSMYVFSFSYVMNHISTGLLNKRNVQCSGGNWKVYKNFFTKQKCQLQMGIAQYKNVATPLNF